MTFNSFQFLVFFVVVVGVYYALAHRWRWLWLLLASCLFYMAFIPVYLLILAVTIGIDFVTGLAIERSAPPVKKFWLILSITATCLILFIFKYFNFFNTNLHALAQTWHWHYPVEMLKIILPIGLSFHTFQSLSYVIEVYRGHQRAERHLGIFALYVMFFPQLVAGPIERPQNLLHQFYQQHHWDYERIGSGLRLMLWGFFKKVVLADTMAIYANTVFDHPQAYAGRAVILATYCFALQIYGDFSGYTDIARGAARVLGFELMKNFKSPYLSASITEFWQRWHISLSSWFRDYVYIPLGGNRGTASQVCGNIMVVFVLSGLWHGANWTFMVWGLCHGLYVAVNYLIRRYIHLPPRLISLTPRVYHVLKVLVVFHLVCFGWILFRASNLSDAIILIKNIFIKPTYEVSYAIPGFERLNMAYALLLFIGMEVVQTYKDKVIEGMASLPWVMRWALYDIFILYVLLMGTYKTQQFIYFQF